MSEPKNWKDLALKGLITILLMFISWMAVEIRATGTETAADVKDLQDDVELLDRALYRKGFIDSLQTKDINVLKGVHEIQ